MSSLSLPRVLELRKLQQPAAPCERAPKSGPATRAAAELSTDKLEVLALHLDTIIREAQGTEGAGRFLPALYDASDALRSELSRRGGR
jgi:hypothetical protein